MYKLQLNLDLFFFLLHKRKKKICLLIWINSLYHTIVLVALTAISLLALNQYLSTNFNFGLRSRQTGKIRKMTFFSSSFFLFYSSPWKRWNSEPLISGILWKVFILNCPAGNSEHKGLWNTAFWHNHFIRGDCWHSHIYFCH